MNRIVANSELKRDGGVGARATHASPRPLSTGEGYVSDEEIDQFVIANQEPAATTSFKVFESSQSEFHDRRLKSPRGGAAQDSNAPSHSISTGEGYVSDENYVQLAVEEPKPDYETSNKEMWGILKQRAREHRKDTTAAEENCGRRYGAVNRDIR